MKNIFGLLLAAAIVSIAFTSCEPANEVKATTGITLSDTAKTIAVGEEFTLTATIEPTDATDKTVVWTSDDTEIATVDGGKVIGVSDGTTEIKATTRDGSKTATCRVTVVSEAIAVAGVTLDVTEKTLNMGTEFTLKATIEPEEATNKEVTWSSDKASVATVDNNGNVKGIAEGEATITVTTKDGGKTATCTVTVVRAALLLEDFTGTWCAPCFYGMKNIQKQIASFGNKVILVSHHLNLGRQDDFTIPYSERLSNFYKPNGIPAVMLDRTKGVDGNAVAFHTGVLTKELLTQKLAQPKTVTISLETSYDESSREIKIKVSGNLLENHPKAKLNVFLVQDSIVGYQNSGGSNYVHHNALRAVISQELWGDDLGTAQGAYTKEYTYNLPQKIGKFATKPDKMYIVAFVADAVSTSGDNTQNIVHNAAIQAIK